MVPKAMRVFYKMQSLSTKTILSVLLRLAIVDLRDLFHIDGQLLLVRMIESINR